MAEAGRSKPAPGHGFTAGRCPVPKSPLPASASLMTDLGSGNAGPRPACRRLRGQQGGFGTAVQNLDGGPRKPGTDRFVGREFVALKRPPKFKPNRSLGVEGHQGNHRATVALKSLSDGRYRPPGHAADGLSWVQGISAGATSGRAALNPQISGRDRRRTRFQAERRASPSRNSRAATASGRT